MNDLVEAKKCPYCNSKKSTFRVIHDENVDVWECFSCGKTFEESNDS